MAILRLSLTLIPRGDERQARGIGRVDIENDCTGTEAVGNYRVTMRGIVHRDVGMSTERTRPVVAGALRTTRVA